jgi:hypothetical protein
MADERPKFDPAKHLRKLRGKGGESDYLDVKFRIVWLRQEHPDCSIETEKIAGGMESNYAEFKARVSIPGKGSATGHGSESKADFGDFIEKAETKAIGRAIAALGYGTQFVGNELDEGERIVDAPVDQQPTPARTPRAVPNSPIREPAADTPAAGLAPYTQREYDAAMDELWQMAEDGKTLDDIKAKVNAHWPRIGKAWRPAALLHATKIEAKYFAPAAQAG